MRAPKLLCVASAVDLDFRYGCTPAWWQLWKGLHEEGVDLVVTPYRGRPVESPWWRTAPNPAYREGESYARARDVARAAEGRPLPAPRRGQPRGERSPTGSRARRSGAGSRRAGAGTSSGSSSASGPTRSSSSPCRWRTSAASPTALRERFGVPVVFYDGDVPMSLPEFGGMDTGFNYYHGADPCEYDLLVSNSEGGLERLLALGARRAEAVFWGADPEFFAPQPVDKETDVFFYGYGDKFRRDWMAAMVGEPSRAAARRRLRARRPRLPGRHRPRAAWSATCRSTSSRGRSRRRGSTSASRAARTRPSTRRRRAGRSSSPRRARRSWRTPTTGSSAGSSRAPSCSSSNDAAEAVDAYRDLLDDPGQAEEMGRRARERVLDEHTYRHRARQLLELVGLRVAAHVD